MWLRALLRVKGSACNEVGPEDSALYPPPGHLPPNAGGPPDHQSRRKHDRLIGLFLAIEWMSTADVVVIMAGLVAEEMAQK
jgi:hypothetical protein